MMKQLQLIALSLLIFAALFYAGMSLGRTKAMANDEIHTQVHSIAGASYLEILSGKKIPEGNNTPLFYLIQKSICDLLDYQTPPAWFMGERRSMDPSSLTILRLNPVLFTTLAAIMIFIYFARTHSLAAGVFGIFVFYSSANIWINWAEARHYALWIFLTTWQTIIFLNLLSSKDPKKLWNSLIIVHFLLSLTTIISLGQIFLISFLLWILKDRRILKYFPLAILPGIISYYYYIHSPTAHLALEITFWDFLTTSVASEYLLLFFFYTCCLCVFYSKNAVQSSAIYQFLFDQDKVHATDLAKNDTWHNGGQVVTLIAGYIVIAYLLFAYLSIAHSGEHLGHKVSSKYFLFLTPPALIAVTYLSFQLLQSFKKYPWLKINIIISLLGLLTLAYLKNYSLWIYFQFIKNQINFS